MMLTMIMMMLTALLRSAGELSPIMGSGFTVTVIIVFAIIIHSDDDNNVTVKLTPRYLYICIITSDKNGTVELISLIHWSCFRCQPMDGGEEISLELLQVDFPFIPDASVVVKLFSGCKNIL